MGIREEQDVKYRADAEAAVAAGKVRIRERDGQTFVHVGLAGSPLGSWFGPFKDEGEAQEYIDAGSFVASWRAGHHVWKVGDRVRYVGKSKRKEYVEDCPIGTEGVITKDNGFDYRFTIQYDNEVPTGISSLHPEGERTKDWIRTSGFGFERINDN